MNFNIDLAHSVQAERCSLFLVDRKNKELIAKVFDGNILPDGTVEVTFSFLYYYQLLKVKASYSIWWTFERVYLRKLQGEAYTTPPPKDFFLQMNTNFPPSVLSLIHIIQILYYSVLLVNNMDTIFLSARTWSAVALGSRNRRTCCYNRYILKSGLLGHKPY